MSNFIMIKIKIVSFEIEYQKNIITNITLTNRQVCSTRYKNGYN